MALYFAAQPPDSRSEPPGSRRTLDDPLVDLFLRRLARLVRLRALTTEFTEPLQVHLVDHAIYSTYLDLQTLGCEEQARALLRAKGRRD